MKTIMKTLLVSIASLSMMFSANSGELSVSGTAKATYNATSGAVTSNNGIGVTNELNFTASGEMDNGYTWSYSMELDPTTKGDTATSPTATQPGGALNDDTQISLKMNDLGTVKVCVSECGNNKKYSWDQSAYTSMTDTGHSSGIGYPSSEAAYASIQYHTPELPFSTTATIAYGNGKDDGQSGNSKGKGAGNSMNAYSLTTKPIDGLTLTGAYYEVEDYDDGVTTEQQLEEGGAWAATYAVGAVTVGYGKSFKAPERTTTIGALGASVVEYYENTGMSIGYAVNDDLSVSFTREESEANYMTSATVSNDVEMDSIQIAYSLGGATLSIARAEYENIGYELNMDATETIIAMSFAF
jgi:outer membrane protein OmpU